LRGGASEFVMANVSDTAGSYNYSPINSTSSNGAYDFAYSGNEKYIDTYAYVTNGNFSYQRFYNRARLGDAIAETELTTTIDNDDKYYAWYDDYSNITFLNSNWIIRGLATPSVSAYIEQAFKTTSQMGIFAFNYNYGISIDTSTRAVLINIPQDMIE